MSKSVSSNSTDNSSSTFAFFEEASDFDSTIYYVPAPSSPPLQMVCGIVRFVRKLLFKNFHKKYGLQNKEKIRRHRSKSSIRRPQLLSVRSVQNPKTSHPYDLLLSLCQSPEDVKHLRVNTELLRNLGISANPADVREELQFFARKCAELKRAEEMLKQKKNK